MSSRRSTRSTTCRSVGAPGRVGRRHDSEEHPLARVEGGTELVVGLGREGVEVDRDGRGSGTAQQRDRHVAGAAVRHRRRAGAR